MLSCIVEFSLNKWNKKEGSPSSFGGGGERQFISLNSSVFIEHLPGSVRRANNDAKERCAMQLNGITFNKLVA